MTWNRLTWTTLLTCGLTLLGCPRPAGPPDSPDASTPDASTGYEWDGGYVPLEETGNPWPDTGAFAPCTVTAASGTDCTDFSLFDLSACDREPLANAGTDGLYLLTTRDDVPLFNATTLNLRGDGGTQHFGGRPITGQASDGNARFYSSSYKTSTGTTWTTLLATCEAPQAPGFTGCTAVCRNGKLSFTETFKAQRMKWRPGESEASGLELVSENPVDIGYPVDVYVTKDHAYVVSIVELGKRGGLTVFDVRDKAAPVKVKTIQLETDNYWNGVWAKGDALYVASSTKGVNVFDISNPADPLLRLNLPGGNINVHTVFVEGNRLYAASSSGVLIFDITNPLEPVELNRYAPYRGLPHDMFATGDRLYVNYAGYGYVVADVSNPSDIRTLGTLSHPDYYHYSHANAVGTFGGRTIAFEGGEGPGEHLRVLDVTDPANIVKIGSFQLRPEISIHNMVLVGKKLYVAWYQEGVRVLDVSNPTQPTQVAYYNTWHERDADPGIYFGGAFGIRVPGDGYLYVADSWRGLLILREQ
jgi:hypothetical protein